MANFFFYFDNSGNKRGPDNKDELKTLVARGIITPQTNLETDSGHRGKAGQIKGLFSVPAENPFAAEAIPFAVGANTPPPQSPQPMPTPVSRPVLSLEGMGGERLEVYEKKMVLVRKFVFSFQGILQFILKGIKGDKTLFYPHITSLQLRKGKLGTVGFLQISIKGGNESVGGILAAVGDENSIRFNPSENDQAQRVHDYIESRILNSFE